jgi:uncharacterized RDD family membrane protein YckC
MKPKKPTFGQKMEAMVVLSLVVWIIIDIASGVLDFITRHWTIFLPLSILLIWWYYFRGEHHG